MFKYVLPIYTLDSDEEIWCATSGLGKTMIIANVCFDNVPQATSEVWKILDCYCEEEDIGITDFNTSELGGIFSGRNDSRKVTRVRVDADGTVTIEITDYSTGITAKHLVDSSIKPSFDIIVRDEDGAPIEKYSISTSIESTTVAEYPFKGGKPIDLESLVPKRYITLRAADPDRCFVAETN
jgi:hypothetical protein